MSRRERFRQERVLRQKILLTLLLCLFFLTAGICAVDYSTNILMNNSRSLALATVHGSDKYLELSLFNEKFRINITYLVRDIKRLTKKAD